jgi:hypothetical protein
MLEVGCPEPAPVLERMLSTRNCCASARHCSAPTVCWLICCVTTYLLDGTAVLSETDCILYYPASVIQKLRPTHSAGHGYASRGYARARSGTAYAIVLSYRHNEEEFMGRRDRSDEPGGGGHGERGDGPRGERDRQGGDRRDDQDRPADRQERKEERQQRKEERQEHRQARQERREERQQRREERQQEEGGDPGGGQDAAGGGDPGRG